MRVVGVLPSMAPEVGDLVIVIVGKLDVALRYVSSDAILNSVKNKMKTQSI
jgi:hypothetical protein